jgi:hypothetical protein
MGANKSSGYIYISYALEDREFMVRLRADLQAKDINLWVNDLDASSIVPQAELETIIAGAICVLVLLSSASVTSKQTQNDIETAFAFEVPLIWMMVSDDLTLPRRLMPLPNIINAFGEQRYQSALASVILNYNTYSKTPQQSALERPPIDEDRDMPEFWADDGSGDRLSSAQRTAPPTTDIQFRVYVADEVDRGARSMLLGYAHTAEGLAAVIADIARFADELGGSPVEYTAGKSVQIERQAEITFVPQSEGIQFEPPSLTKTWLDDDWLRYYFEYRIPATFSGYAADIYVSVRINGLEVGFINTYTEIVTATSENPSPKPLLPKPTNPLAAAKQRAVMHDGITMLHTHIFISYAHQDRKIALKRVGEIERVLGSRVFIDVKNLRAGDDWEAALAIAIDEADVFHLLWSRNAAQSKYCRYEWDYALNHKCADNRCVNIIQPVYWHQPMPPPPPELNHLHFEYVNFGLQGFSLTEWFNALIDRVRGMFK